MTSVLDKEEYNQSKSFSTDHCLNYTKQQGISSSKNIALRLDIPDGIIKDWPELKSQAGAPTFV